MQTLCKRFTWCLHGDAVDVNCVHEIHVNILFIWSLHEFGDSNKRQLYANMSLGKWLNSVQTTVFNCWFYCLFLLLFCALLRAKLASSLMRCLLIIFFLDRFSKMHKRRRTSSIASRCMDEDPDEIQPEPASKRRKKLDPVMMVLMTFAGETWFGCKIRILKEIEVQAYFM